MSSSPPSKRLRLRPANLGFPSQIRERSTSSRRHYSTSAQHHRIARQSGTGSHPIQQVSNVSGPNQPSQPAPEESRQLIPESSSSRPAEPGAEPRPLSYFVQSLDHDVEHSEKFKLLKTRSRFSIKNIPKDPEDLLAAVFHHCFETTMAEGEARGVPPDHLGCMITSEQLDEEIYTPIRPITKGTLDAILKLFLKVAQSKEYLPRPLWSMPFEVEMTGINKSKLPTKRSITGGARRKGPLAPVHHRINNQHLIKINNNDGRCLFYALQATMMQKTKNWPRWKFARYLRGEYGMAGLLKRDTEQLMRKIGAPLGQDEYSAEDYIPLVVDYWNNELFKDKLLIKVFVFNSMGHYKPAYKYGAKDYNTAFLLYHDRGHFDGVQRAGNLFGTPYCLECERPYTRPSEHTLYCRAMCHNCSRVGPGFPCAPTPGYFNHCQACNKRFFDPDCYRHHLQNNNCAKFKRCGDCGLIWGVNNNTQNGRGGHVCGEVYCRNCCRYHQKGSFCFIRPIEPKKEELCRTVAFDTETMQYEEYGGGKKKHRVNFVSARITCQLCIANGQWKESLKNNEAGAKCCKVCGPNRTITFSHRPFEQTTVDEQRVTEHPMADFMHYLLFELPKKYTTYAFSHYGSRFDMMFAFRQLYLNGLNPQFIRNGGKIFSMEVVPTPLNNGRVIFRDSWLLLHNKLEDLPATYGLEIEDKGFFPHLLNRPESYGKQLYPQPEDYMADLMMPEKKKKFDEFYAEHKDEPFLLEEALPIYCCRDTDILMHALIAFRREFMEITRRPPDQNGNAQPRRANFGKPHAGIDPLVESITIASACMKSFRANHLPSQHLAIVPTRGYDNADNQSLLALKFLQWVAEKRGVPIQTAHSPEGEKKVATWIERTGMKTYKLDGWIESEQTGIEVHGCPWHGCEKCYPDDGQMLPTGKTAGRQRELDAERMEAIRRVHPNIEVYWTCQIQEMLEADKEMKARFDSYQDNGPIRMRSCFFGGRTGPFRLFYRVKPGEKTSYYDFTSLYPTVNFMLDPEFVGYPLGHPEVHILDEIVNWRCPKDNPYPLALLKVFVVPPRMCDVPVLPMKFDGDDEKDPRLLFCLCRTCAQAHPNGAVDEHYSCEHTDEQRGWIGSYFSAELNAALEEDYRVTKVFRVLEWQVADRELFRSYMREQLTEKIHASGFDEQIRGDEQKEEQFIRECAERFGMQIKREKMIPNKGRRKIAKDCVNNLWGKFGMRSGLQQTCVSNDPAQIAEHLNNPRIDITFCDMINKETALISYEEKKEWVEDHDCSNVIVAAYTTSCARVMLLRAMQKVVRSPGCKLLYIDTDSLIFVHPEHANPLADQLGPHIGQFTDECPGYRIVEASFGGPKAYGMELEDVDGNTVYTLKIKGHTLTHNVIEKQGFYYESFREKVLKYAREGIVEPVVIDYPSIIRPNLRAGCVLSYPQQKIYKVVVSKGVVRPSDYTVREFGSSL